MIRLYRAFSLLGYPITPFWFLWRFLSKKTSFERLLPPERIKSNNIIWIHALSVGELFSAQNLILNFKKNLPGIHLHLTVSTKTAWDQALLKLKDSVDSIGFFPIDLPGLAELWLSRINPRLIILVEGDIWPNFIRTAFELKIPVILANGRISPKSLSRYMLFKPIIKGCLDKIDYILAGSYADIKRYTALGASKEKLLYIGNLKYSADMPKDTRSVRVLYRKQLNLDDKARLLLAGSTHPGEEEILISACRNLIESGEKIFLMIAPRDIKRSQQIKKIAEKHGFKGVLRSRAGDHSLFCDTVYIIDTLGELADLYAVSDIAFTGGSLVERGGHNPIEPARWSVPVLTGPSVFNFQEIIEDMEQKGGLVKVQADSLTQILASLLKDNEKLRHAGTMAARTAGFYVNICENYINIIRKAAGL